MRKYIIPIILYLVVFTNGEVKTQTIAIRIPDTTVVAGGKIDIPIYIDSTVTGKNVTSYMLQLVFDQNYLQPISVITAGTISASLGTPTVNTSFPGKINIAGAGTTPLTGVGKFIYVRFKTLQPGYNNLFFSDASNNYFNEGTPELSFTNGTVDITTPPTITVTPDNGIIAKGEVFQFNVNDGVAPYQWFVTNSSIASVDANGMLTATQTGITKVVAQDNNGIRDTSNTIEIRAMRITVPDDLSQWQGSYIDVPINVSNVTGLNITSGNLEFSFNPNILTPVSISQVGTLLASFATPVLNTSIPGHVSFAFAGTTPISGAGPLMYLRFLVNNVNNGNTEINLVNGLFNETLQPAFTNGIFTSIELPILTISPNTGFLVAGETQQFAVTGGGIPPFVWSINDTGVATISQSGLMTAKRSGTVIISAHDSLGAVAQSGTFQIYDTRINMPDTGTCATPTFYYPIQIETLPVGQSVMSLQATLNYDTTYLTFLDIENAGTLTNGWVYAKNESAGHLVFAGSGSTAFSNSGTIVKLKFTVKPTLTAGSTAFINVINFGLNEGIPFPLVDINGSITGATPTDPAGSISGNPTVCQGEQGVSYSVPTINGASGYIWTLPSGASIAAGNNSNNITVNYSNTAVSGNITVKGTSACGDGTASSFAVTVNAKPTVPTVGTIIQPTCGLATGSVTLNGLPAGNWTINPGGITGNTTSKTISGLTAETTYNFTVTNASGCTSNASADVIINAQPVLPTAPTVGAITQPTCAMATGSVVLSGLPTGNWTVNPGAITGNTTTTTISGLTAGTTYHFTVTNSIGCTSPSSAGVVIITQPPLPAAPTIGTITHPTCTMATGSVVLSGLPVGNWTINPGAITGNTTSTTISNLTAGANYQFTVTNSIGCTSLASTNVAINAQPITPNVSDQTISIQTGGTFTITPSGVPAGTTFTWTVPTYTNGVTGGSAQTTPQTSISGTLSIPSGTGTATYLVTPTSGSCVGNTFTVTVTVDVNCVAVAIASQPANTNMCATVGNASFTVAASGTSPFAYQWQYYDGTTWENITNGTPTGAVYANATTETIQITGINPDGAYQYRCSVTNCGGANNASSNAATLTVNAPPSAPTIDTIFQPTCVLATGSVILEGLPTGNWILNPGAIAGNTSTATISGLDADSTYAYTVTNASGCVSIVTEDIVINSQPETPVVANQSTSILSGETFNITPTGVPSGTTYTWSAPAYTGGVTGGSAQTISQTSISGTLAIPSGSGTASYTVTPTSGACIGAEFTVTVYFDCLPVAITTQPTDSTICATTGEASFSVGVNGNSPYTFEWQFNNGGNWIGITNGNPSGAVYTNEATSTMLVSGISAAGTLQYRCSVTNCSGSSYALSNVVQLTVNETPPAPSTIELQQPTCDVSTGTITILAPVGVGMTYSIDGINYTNTTGVFTLITANTYPVTAKNASGCISPTTNVTINTQPQTPVTPIISQAGSVLHSSATAGNQWYNQNGLINLATNQDYTPTEDGDYYVIVTLGGCSSEPSNSIHVIVIDVESTDANNPLNIYPNPVTDKLVIEVDNKNINFEIYNSIGQVVYKGKLNNRTVIETTNLVPDIYLIKLENSQTMKFSKTEK